MLRTIELILGLKPLTQFDAPATPLTASFTDTPNLARYDAIKPEQSLTAPNKTNAPMAKASGKMDLSKEDRAPAGRLNEAIWKSVRGARSAMPAPRHKLNVEEEDGGEKGGG